MSKPTAARFPWSLKADLPPDDLLREVFLNLPPDPRNLLTASLVCRHWRCLIRDPAFLRRFLAFHRTPPLLGFYQNGWFMRCTSPRPCRNTRFVPTSAAASRLSLPEPKGPTRVVPDCRHGCGPTRVVLDCRHGRVLLYSHAEAELLVWHPMAGDMHHVSPPPASVKFNVTAALVCSAAGDHLTDCHSWPFQIVFLDSTKVDGLVIVSVCVYSSETGSWSETTTITSRQKPMSHTASAIVGDSVYWLLNSSAEDISRILEFELPTQRLAVIEMPENLHKNYELIMHVMAAEDGGIEFAGVRKTSLHFWSRKTTDRSGTAGWTIIRSVDLGKFTLPGRKLWSWTSAIEFTEDPDVLFLSLEAAIFMINLRSMELTQVPEAYGVTICPYASFYNQGRYIVGIDDRDEQ